MCIYKARGNPHRDTAEPRFNNHKIYIAVYLSVYICVYIRLGLTRIETRRSRGSTTTRYIYLYIYVCSADGSTHTESNKLYRKVKHRYRPNLSPCQRPTAEARHDQAALAASAEARGATHRARPRSPSHELPALTALAQHISHSHSGIDEKRPTEKFVYIYIRRTGVAIRWIPGSTTTRCLDLYIYMYIYVYMYICIYIGLTR